MLSKLKSFFILVNLLLLSQAAISSHVVGGYLSYTCNGSVSSNLAEYEVSFRIYFDCENGSSVAIDQDSIIPITVFNPANNVEQVVLLSRSSYDTIPDDIDNPCVVRSPEICVTQGFYSGLIRLNKSFENRLVFQRCCKNSTIDNIPTPDDFGNTFMIEVPAFNTYGCNSSPDFNSFPPIVLCSQFDVNIDISATDQDGDSLVYSFCAPLNYSTLTAPSPNPATRPPYFEVPYLLPQSASNPVPSSPQITIDPKTGRMNGKPTALGQYLVGFCIEEYRNGSLLSTTRRDIQINTTDCDPVITSAVQDREILCNGLSVKFINLSTSEEDIKIQNYKWDFGDLSTFSDTSRVIDTARVSYTYPDTGLYAITLIANPDLPCSDTSIEEVRVYKELSPIIDYNGITCVDFNSVNFIAKGQYEDFAIFDWDFGSSANINSSTLDSVGDVVFSGNGTFNVELIVTQNLCIDTVVEQIVLFENPIADFSFGPVAGCYPLEVNFSNNSTFDGSAEFLWSFGDGNSSTLREPKHTYLKNGLYDIQLEVKTTNNCIDTVISIDIEAVKVSLDSSKNNIAFDIQPKEACPGTPINFIDQSFYEGNANYYWDLGNNTISNEQNHVYLYQDTGWYQVGLLLIPFEKCVDTLTLKDSIRILPVPVSNLTVSKDSSSLKQALINFDVSESKFESNSTLYIDGNQIIMSENIDYKFSDTGHFQVFHIVENEFGCFDTSSAEIYVYDEFEFLIPNIFTPNGDLLNDQFKVRACGVYDYQIDIFNRFGLKLFSSNSMNINWDGKIGGRKASSGIYYYKIRIKDFKGDFIDYTGPLTLLRE